MPQCIQLLIVDDHPALRRGLIALIQHEPDLTVVAEASNGIEAVEKAHALQPDVILMDLALPRKNGLEAIREICADCPEIKILVFSSFSDGDRILAAMQAGAIGYLTKDGTPQEIFDAIRAVHQGKPTLNPQVELSLLHQIQYNHVEDDLAFGSLTVREIEILRWLAQGLTNGAIAKNAEIKEGTVRSHISNLLNKLGLSNRAQAAIYAIRKGLIDLNVDSTSKSTIVDVPSANWQEKDRHLSDDEI